MPSFTETFLKTPLEQRPEVVDTERQRRVLSTPEAYVAVPVIVPKMSSMVQGAVADYELFWLIGLPGPVAHPKYPDKMAREAINFQCTREETAEDMIYMLNLARVRREMLHNELQSEQPAAEAPVAPAEPEIDPSKLEDALTMG